MVSWKFWKPAPGALCPSRSPELWLWLARTAAEVGLRVCGSVGGCDCDSCEAYTMYIYACCMHHAPCTMQNT